MRARGGRGDGRSFGEGGGAGTGVGDGTGRATREKLRRLAEGTRTAPGYGEHLARHVPPRDPTDTTFGFYGYTRSKCVLCFQQMV